MTKKLNIDIIAKDKSQQALKKVQGNLDNVKKSVFNLRNALAGIGAGAIIKSFIDVGAEVENLQLRFKFLFGTAEEGAKAFDNLSKFAGRVPFSLQEISRASGVLAVVSKDAEDLTRILDITGNVAAFLGLDFETTASQIQRSFSAGISAADIFREKGLRDVLGFEAGAKVSIEETIQAFERVFGSGGRLGDVTGELANTLTGQASMVQDKFRRFQEIVAKQFVDSLKFEVGQLNVILEENEKVVNDVAVAFGQTLKKSLELALDGVQTLTTAIIALTETKQAIDELLPAGLKLQDIFMARFFKTFAENLEEVETGLSALAFQMEINSKRMFELKQETEETEKVLQRTFKVFPHMLESGAKAQSKLSFVQKENKVTLQGLNSEMSAFSLVNTRIIDQTELLKEKFPQFTKTLEDAGNQTKQLDGLFTNTFNSFADTLANSIMTGKFAFKDFARSVIADIARIIAKQQALLAIQKISGLFGGSLFGFNIGGLLPAPRSSGGRVNAGMPYMTGEAGKELFIPQTSGTIIPNNQLASAGTTNINFTINTVDAQGVDELLTNRRSTIINVINDALNRQGKEALV
tara:strand:+ start:8903 stop:10642 length:1740 start_codon:yes stop_codon:yes gene_type:complete